MIVPLILLSLRALPYLKKHKTPLIILLSLSLIFNEGTIAQANIGNTDVYLVAVNAPHDTTVMKRFTDSLFSQSNGTFTFTGMVNPRRYYPGWLLQNTDTTNIIQFYRKTRSLFTNGWGISPLLMDGQAIVDTSVVMSKANAANSIIAFNAALVAKYDTANSKGYITSASISGKLNVTDTASMLSPYLRAAIASATYQPVGSYATTTNLALKVNISDTATMLNPYLRKADTASLSNRINAKGSGTLIGTDTVSLSNRINTKGIGTLVGSDTVSLSTRINARVKYTDTASMLANIYTSLTSKLNKSDSATYASKYGIDTLRNDVYTSLASKLFISNADTLSASRAFNTAYQMSTTKYVEVCASSKIACSLSLTGGQEGTISLQTSVDNITWVTKAITTGSNTGTLTIGLATLQTNGGPMCAMVPPNYYWKLLTTNTTGTPTFTMQVGNKTTY